MPKLQVQVSEEMLARIDALAHRQDRDTDRPAPAALREPRSRGQNSSRVNLIIGL